MMRKSFAIAALLLAGAMSMAQESANIVGTINVDGLPGPLVLTGKARALLVGTMGGQMAVAGAEAPLGKGRVIAFGHGSFLTPTATQAVTKDFLIALGKSFAKNQPIAVETGWTQTITTLKDAGLDAQAFDPQAAPRPGQFSAVFLDAGRLSAQSAPAWKKYVEAGGVVVTGVPGWGWQQLNPDKSLSRDFGAAALYAPAGIHWTTATFDSGDGYKPADPAQLLNATTAIQKLRSADKEKLSPADTRSACQQLQFALDALPADDETHRAIASYVERIPVRWPSEKTPVKQGDALNRLAIAYATQRDASLPPEKIKPNSTAADFPGAVPSDAKRVTKSMTVDRAVPGWFVTGLYAAPGQLITVTLPTGAKTDNLGLRIGSTTCANWGNETWTRAPKIDHEQPLKPGKNTIASAFGGPIYISVPDNDSGELKITVAGGVAQPVFVLGRDTDEAWKTIRNNPAPWAELSCPGIAISLPSEYIRNLENPTALMQWWQNVLDVQDHLSPRPGFPKRGERITLDREICAGYMHSGYPVMTGMDVAKEFVDLESLKTKGNWGIYHELGHNHQWEDWTFDGTGEVTNNIFSLYCYAKINPGVLGHDAMSAKSTKEAMSRLWSPQGPADQYQKDPFYALMMYQQVIDRFGFEPFERFFAKAAKKPKEERPTTDQQKRDTWLIDLSNEVQYNLTSLFTSWGVVTTEEAQAKVKSLPVFEVKQ